MDGTLSSGSQRLVLQSVYTIALCLNGKVYVVEFTGVASVRGTGRSEKDGAAVSDSNGLSTTPVPHPSVLPGKGLNTGLRTK